MNVSVHVEPLLAVPVVPLPVVDVQPLPAVIGLIRADVPPGVLVESLEGNCVDRQDAKVRKGQICSRCGASGINEVSKLMLHSKSVICYL